MSYRKENSKGYYQLLNTNQFVLNFATLFKHSFCDCQYLCMPHDPLNQLHQLAQVPSIISDINL